MPRLPLGRHLVLNGAITEAQLVEALQLQLRLNAPLGKIIVAEGWAEPRDILDALSAQSGLQIADLAATPPASELGDLMPVAFWLKHAVVPWIRMGPIVLVATSRPDRFPEVADAMAAAGLTAMPVLAGLDHIHAALARLFAAPLAKAAETCVEPSQSCRDWTFGARLPAILTGILILLVAVAFPELGLAALIFASVLTLSLFMALRLAGFAAHVAGRTHLIASHPGPRLPPISVLVPLYKEREIADALVRRLGRLNYPKALLDVILVLEEKDGVTQAALSAADLPHWMRVIKVPDLGGLTTKPRAMNFALDFCRGEIVGVWDAEDAPAPDQLERVAARFAQAPPDVVCLQGILDYYNPRTNWRARCFTIEYCSWFRVILPGIARLGLVVPLGGTTLFFRRQVLEELGRWDAHNVTEDADLGVRLCRAGYRTEMIDTVTHEEASFRAWPWVRQRSRWLKGFMVTYLVHMRAPRRLLADLGLWRFVGFQAFFLGTLGQFLLAPVLWSLWLLLFGLPHPIAQMVAPPLMAILVGFLVLAELLNILIGLTAVSAKDRRFLMPWVPTMMAYFPLGAVAAYKALWELAIRPFFWDKTQHGQAPEEDQPA
ncbi:glycosyltransferase family 2 protein [Ruegeria sediminis]|uniref:glycosyltransferase family 2 protein n=1 Tax=Ruegeria sediminis TaxID=2583820 RepID=UPI001FE4419B|nr:glycosyltransferase family 2 protein [Ruegeria sediminis]